MCVCVHVRHSTEQKSLFLHGPKDRDRDMIEIEHAKCKTEVAF